MKSKSSVEKHFDRVARDYDYGKSKYSYYYGNLKKLLGGLIPKNKKVFEIGCGTGDLLVSLKPKDGYGMDISGKMVRIAKAKHNKSKNVKFSRSWPKGKFDYIFMSDVVEHLEYPRDEFKKAVKLMNTKSVFVNTMANPVWEPLLMFWERMRWKMEEGKHKRMVYNDLNFMMQECGLKIIKHDYKLLVPIKIPVLTKFVNTYLENLFRKYAFIEYFMAVKS